MHYGVWLFLTGVLGALALLAGSFGAHRLSSLTTAPTAVKIFETAVLYHSLHVLALLGVAILLAATDQYRSRWAGRMLNLAAAAFTGGVVLFSGGIYVQIVQGFQSSAGIVPAGGILLIAGWIALALSAFGLRTPKAVP